MWEYVQGWPILSGGRKKSAITPSDSLSVKVLTVGPLTQLLSSKKLLLILFFPHFPHLTWRKLKDIQQFIGKAERCFSQLYCAELIQNSAQWSLAPESHQAEMLAHQASDQMDPIFLEWDIQEAAVSGSTLTDICMA